MYDRILAAIDLTPNENAVLHHTQQLAKLTGATVHLLHVAPVHLPPAEITIPSAVASEDEVDFQDLSVIDEAAAQLAAGGVSAKGEVLKLVSATERDIAEVIVRRAKELDARLIILGETLHRRALKLFRGSVAESVLHMHPECPILLVP
jgi:nucleotide-binding universal stress UspA family protein